MHFNISSNFMLSFLILETYLKYVVLVLGERGVEKKIFAFQEATQF